MAGVGTDEEEGKKGERGKENGKSSGNGKKGKKAVLGIYLGTVKKITKNYQNVVTLPSSYPLPSQLPF